MSKKAEIANDRAIEYWKRDRFAEAIAQWEDALRNDPEIAEIHHNLGKAYAYQNLSDKAVESLKRALSIDPTLIEAHNKLGCIYYEQGNRELAIASWREALDVDPDFREALHNLHLAESAPPLDVGSEIPEYVREDSEVDDEKPSWLGRLFGRGKQADSE